jgi:hypothetical protein
MSLSPAAAQNVDAVGFSDENHFTFSAKYLGEDEEA